VVASGALLRRFFANVYVATFSAHPLNLPILLEEGACFYLRKHFLVSLFVMSFGYADCP
jgi:hypothetical protein